MNLYWTLSLNFSVIIFPSYYHRINNSTLAGTLLLSVRDVGDVP